MSVSAPHTVADWLRSSQAVGCALAALVVLWGALLSPWGMASSHGLADWSASQHGLDTDAAHGHSHDDEEVAEGESGSSGSHPHHAMDHSHETAHGLPAPIQVALLQQPADRTGFPHGLSTRALLPLDRPPRA